MIMRMNGYEMAFIIYKIDNFVARYVFTRILLDSNIFVNTVTKVKNVALTPYFQSTSRMYGVTLPGPSSKVRVIYRDFSITFNNYLF